MQKYIYSTMPPKRKKPKDVWTGRRKEAGYFKPRDDEKRQGPMTERDYEFGAVRTTRRMDLPKGKTHDVKKRKKPEEYGEGDYL